MVVLAVVVPLTPLIVTVELPVVAELLAANVTTLLPVEGLVPKVAVTPLGKPEADSVTLPVKPPLSVTVIVSVALEPCVTESVGADAASEKPLVVIGFTVSAIVVLAVVVPLVPVMVTVELPVAAELLAANVTTLLPVVGLVPNVAVTPLGKLDADSVTLPVKPPLSVTVIVSVPLEPCVTESDGAEAASVKPLVTNGFTVSAIVVVAVVVPLVPVMVTMELPVAAVLLAANVTTLLLVVGLVANVAVTPLGRPDAASVTLPVKLPVSVTVIVSVALEPCAIVRDAGDAASVKPDVVPPPSGN